MNENRLNCLSQISTKQTDSGYTVALMGPNNLQLGAIKVNAI